MSDTAGRYDVIQDFGTGVDPDHLDLNAFWCVAVIRLGQPLSFSRHTMSSVTKDLTAGALLRATKALVITDDILHLTIGGGKSQHKKQMSFSAIQSQENYLVSILPGDHVLAWLLNNKTDFEKLLTDIDAGNPCNRFDSGLKFVGRVTSVRKHVQKDPGSGTKTSSYNISCSGFEELDAQFFYDASLMSKDVLERDFGQWMTRIGLDVQRLFSSDVATGISKNNGSRLISTLLDLIVGKGPDASGNIDVVAAGNKTVSATPQVTDQAPYSYLIPQMVGKLLGKMGQFYGDPPVLGYSHILELMHGVQSYNNKSGWQVFIPDLTSESTPQRRICPNEVLGTYLPALPDFANKPVWNVLQQYTNPVINEMYTALRVNPEGNIVPTIVLRQIPFTTNSFEQGADEARNIPVTRFLSLPRWIIPSTMIQSLDIGRSDQTRINFVHVYASNSYQQNAISVQEQLVNNPPIIDHLDVMRSGIRSYMTTVESWVDDTVGKAPRQWINLVADWTMGSQYTLNGTVECYGIQSPIVEGDCVEIDGVVFMIESVTHTASIQGDGRKSWRTTLQLTNGMRADTSNQKEFPLYPGFSDEDNKGFDPGLTLEQRATAGGKSDTTSQLDPSTDTGKA